jgi:hypothetical protein
MKERVECYNLGLPLHSPHEFQAVVLPSVGTWLSLVEHSLGVRGVGSSNLPVPTNSQF